jgi:hypothetical protein
MNNNVNLNERLENVSKIFLRNETDVSVKSVAFDIIEVIIDKYKTYKTQAVFEKLTDIFYIF